MSTDFTTTPTPEPTAKPPIEFTSHRYGVHIPLPDLKVDLNVQRALVDSRVRKLVGSFDPAAIGELLVSKREDGLYILDGHHRQRVLEQVNGHEPAECELYEGLSREDEARLFLLRNDRANIAKTDRDRNYFTFGDPATLDIQAACQAHGYVFIANSAAERTFNDRSAAVAVMNAAERSKKWEGSGAQHFSDMLAFYASTWERGWPDGPPQEVPETPILKALSRIFLRFELDTQRLRKVLGSLPPQQVVANGLSRQYHAADTRRMSLITAVAEEIAALYNAGLGAANRIRL